MSGSSTQYTIAGNTPSQGYLSDNVADRDGTSVPVNGNTIGFSNGMGFIDPSGNSEQIARLYQAILGRHADTGGEGVYTGMVDTAATTALGVAGVMVASTEFANFGSLTNAQFVNKLYQNVGGTPDSNATSLLNSLNAGASKAQVALTFSNQSAAVNGTLSYSGDAAESETYRLYQTVLGRAPDAGGLASYINLYASGMTSAAVAQTFTSSAEFASKYGTPTNTALVTQFYQNDLARVPDAGGLNYWVAQLNAGTSASGVALGIANSLESRLDSAPATHDAWVFLGQPT